MKKKSQINADKIAASRTGRISKTIATKDTEMSRINPRTLYPSIEDIP
jgi:hypothetical protein